jgi:hypothetical protein
MKSPKIPKQDPIAPPVSQRAGEIEATELEAMKKRRNNSAFANTILRGPGSETPTGTRNTLGY